MEVASDLNAVPTEQTACNARARALTCVRAFPFRWLSIYQFVSACTERGAANTPPPPPFLSSQFLPAVVSTATVASGCGLLLAAAVFLLNDIHITLFPMFELVCIGESVFVCSRARAQDAMRSDSRRFGRIMHSTAI